jgi:hypothetical protein
MRTVAAAAGLLLVFSVTTAAAQEREFGAKLGPNFSVLSLEVDFDGTDYDRRIAIAVGGFIVLPVARTVSVQIEGLFNPKGAKLYDAELGATSTLLLDYVEFPLLARVSGPRPRSLHVFAGPYFAIRVGATRQISVTGPGFTAGERTDMGGEVERFDTGLVAGGGFHVRERMVIDARYSWGFRDVNTDTTDGVRFHHRVLTVMAGMRF